MTTVTLHFLPVARRQEAEKDFRDKLVPEDFGFLRLTCAGLIHHLPDSDPHKLSFAKFQNYLDQKVDLPCQDIAAILDKFFAYYNLGAHNDKHAPDAPERLYSHMALKWIAEIAEKLQPPQPRGMAKLIKFTARNFQ